jgi:hypothetical protein
MFLYKDVHLIQAVVVENSRECERENEKEREKLMPEPHFKKKKEGERERERCCTLNEIKI